MDSQEMLELKAHPEKRNGGLHTSVNFRSATDLVSHEEDTSLYAHHIGALCRIIMHAGSQLLLEQLKGAGNTTHELRFLT